MPTPKGPLLGWFAAATALALTAAGAASAAASTPGEPPAPARAPAQAAAPPPASVSAPVPDHTASATAQQAAPTPQAPQPTGDRTLERAPLAPGASLARPGSPRSAEDATGPHDLPARRLGPRHEFDPSSLMGQSLAAVLIILVLGGIALYVVKRVLPRLGIAQGRRVQVIETVYLAPRASLHVVQALGRTLLVASGKEGLSLLADLTDWPEAESPGGSAEGDEAGDHGNERPPRQRQPVFTLPRGVGTLEGKEEDR